MLLILILLALAAWSAVATIVELQRDGFRRTPTDWSRIAGRDDAAPHAHAGHIYR